MRKEWRDPETGLVWAVEPEPSKYTYYDAMVMEWGDGWRLPTIQELFSIIDFSKLNPAIKAGLVCKSNNNNYFNNYFWSSSLYAGSTHSVWVVDFSVGFVSYSTRNTSHAVRLVKV